MAYEIEEIAKALHSARVAKGLSQRALSERAGVPQPHISKIERGHVDLRLSSLIAVARVLDLEVALVPRNTVSAVQSIIRSSEPAKTAQSTPAVLKELQRLQQTLAHIEQVTKGPTELIQFQRQLRELQHLPLAHEHLAALKNANSALEAFKKHQNANGAVQAFKEFQNANSAGRALKGLHEGNSAVEAFKKQQSGTADLRRALSDLQTLRNAIAHQSDLRAANTALRPAYTLDDEEVGDG
jgi:transcriptional regulator with XRE-family HTH domain